MWVYLSLVGLVCMISYLFQRTDVQMVGTEKGCPIKMKRRFVGNILVFFILAAFSIARDGIGIDFEGYYKHILLIQKGYPHYMEAGFQYLVQFLARFSANPRWVIIVLAFFTCLFYVLVIVKWSKNTTLGLLIFLTWGYYFFSFNTIRNYFAQSLALISLLFLVDKKYIKFLICILMAALFHKSALVCIPLYLLAQYDYKKKYIPIVISSIVVAFVFKDDFRRLFFLFYPGYEGSVYDTGEVSWLNIIKAIIVIGIGILFYKQVEKDKINRICFNLNVLSLIFYVGFYWTPEISRIGFYMNTTAIILVPRILSQIDKRNKNRDIVTFAVAIGSFVLFILLMRGWYRYTIQLLPYKTWLGGTF